MKKEKKKRLDPIPKINRRLFRLWSDAVRERSGYKCEYCGIENGAINQNGKPTKIDAHHLMNRKITDCPLKFDIRNGVSVCPICHKFSPDNSFHFNPVNTIAWVVKNCPERSDFVINYYKTRVNLSNREILQEIEERLEAKEPLDLNKLIVINEKAKEEERQRELEKEKAKQTLFDVVKPPVQ